MHSCDLHCPIRTRMISLLTTPLKDALSGPSPYGTRSRNRGQARPNYAEDSMDIDAYEAPSDKKDDEAKKLGRQTSNGASAVPDAPRPAAASTRKSLLVEDKSSGTQTPIVNGSATPSNAPTPATTVNLKKRKAAQANGTNAQVASQTAPATNASTTGSRRGAAQPALPSNPTGGYRESNLLTFDDCGGKLKQGKLFADDGTSIAQNGKCTSDWVCICVGRGASATLARRGRWG